MRLSGGNAFLGALLGGSDAFQPGPVVFDWGVHI